MISEFPELRRYLFFETFFSRLNPAIPLSPKQASAPPQSDGTASEISVNMSPRVQISPLTLSTPHTLPIYHQDSNIPDDNDSIYSHQLDEPYKSDPSAKLIKKALHGKTRQRQIDELIKSGCTLEKRNKGHAAERRCIGRICC